MCQHSISAKEITEKLQFDLYPAIEKQFKKLEENSNEWLLLEEHKNIREAVYSLKNEFVNLENYETKLVFPNVLKVFNTKDNPNYKPTANLLELQKLTQNKEQHIWGIISDVEACLSENNVTTECIWIDDLLILFKTKFKDYKNQWNSMLQGWQNSCACFQINAVHPKIMTS